MTSIEQKQELNSKEGIRQSFNSVSDYKQLYDQSLNILKYMQDNFYQTLSENVGYEYANNIDATRFNKFNTANPTTIFEKEGKKLIEQSKTIAENNAVKNASIQVLGKLGYTRVTDEAKDKITDRLWKIQQSAVQNVIKDKNDDGIINQIENTTITGIIMQGENIGEDWFWKKETNPKEFKEHISKISDKDLILGALNMPEGIGAFNTAYEELTKRLNGSNIFQKIDEITNEWGTRNDQIRDFLIISCFSTLIARRKLDELETRVNAYSKKGDILQYIKNKSLQSPRLKNALLLEFEALSQMTNFQNITTYMTQKDPQIKRAIDEKNNTTQSIDIFTSKKVNGLIIFDNEGNGGGAAFFEPSIVNLKAQGFIQKSQETNSKYNKVVLTRGEDTMTLVGLKIEKEEIKNVIPSLKNGEKHNLFVLRGHCYSTDKMAIALGNNNMVAKSSILVDGGCWNAKKIPDYKKQGVHGPIFAYTGAGKGDSTQAFTNKILETKEKGSFNNLMNFYKQLDTEQNTYNGYFAANTLRPDSIYYFYHNK